MADEIKTGDIKGREKEKDTNFVADCKIILKNRIYQRGDPIKSGDLEYCKAHNLVVKKQKRRG